MQIPRRRTGLTCRLAPFTGAAAGAEVAREGGVHCWGGYLRGPEAGRVPHSVLTRADLLAGEITRRQQTRRGGETQLQVRPSTFPGLRARSGHRAGPGPLERKCAPAALPSARAPVLQAPSYLPVGPAPRNNASPSGEMSLGPRLRQ